MKDGWTTDDEWMNRWVDMMNGGWVDGEWTMGRRWMNGQKRGRGWMGDG